MGRSCGFLVRDEREATLRARGWPIPVVAALGLTGALILTVPTPPPAAGQPPEAGVPSEAARSDPRPDDAFADPAVAELQRKVTDAQRELTGEIGRAHV